MCIFKRNERELYKLPWNTYYVYRLALIFHLRICIDAQFSIEILLMYAFQYLLVFLNDIIFPITYMLQNVSLGIYLYPVLNVWFNIIFLMYYFFLIDSVFNRSVLSAIGVHIYWIGGYLVSNITHIINIVPCDISKMILPCLKDLSYLEGLIIIQNGGQI